MEYKKAIEVLLKLLKEKSFTKEERQAITTAIGTLDFGALAKNRMRGIIKAKKEKREKDLKC